MILPSNINYLSIHKWLTSIDRNVDIDTNDYDVIIHQLTLMEENKKLKITSSNIIEWLSDPKIKTIDILFKDNLVHTRILEINGVDHLFPFRSKSFGVLSLLKNRIDRINSEKRREKNESVKVNLIIGISIISSIFLGLGFYIRKLKK